MHPYLTHAITHTYPYMYSIYIFEFSKETLIPISFSSMFQVWSYFLLSVELCVGLLSLRYLILLVPEEVANHLGLICKRVAVGQQVYCSSLDQLTRVRKIKRKKEREKEPREGKLGDEWALVVMRVIKYVIWIPAPPSQSLQYSVTPRLLFKARVAEILCI